MKMSIANYFIPEIILLITLLVGVAVSFLVFSSLRKYRRKRNLLIYVALAIILSVLAYQTYDSYLGPAIVSYSLESEPFLANRVNPLEVSAESLSSRPTSFNLVLTASNSSLIADGQDNIQINSTAIKLQFNLNGLYKEVTKTVHFQMDENVTGCVFYCHIEEVNHRPIVTGSTERAESVWNSNGGRYNLNRIMGPLV